jgi:hypothetical protein
MVALSTNATPKLVAPNPIMVLVKEFPAPI